MKENNANVAVEEITEETVVSFQHDSPESIYVEDHVGAETEYLRADKTVSKKQAVIGGAVSTLAAAAAGFVGGAYYERRKRNSMFKVLDELVQEIETGKTNDAGVISGMQADIVNAMNDAKLSTKETIEWNKLFNRFITVVSVGTLTDKEITIIDEKENLN